ncbi:RsmB/NOP family class I SAM-dependent RNA methyltransferase [Phenylobacterium sp. J426]|uniref:RsmB/NOP family class I SAM-dependent RNA methyltransferase n=1 Tax=Phenylobacterium sp. J426 TaxID=2898439 RepID=UPI002151E8F0|nr:RsmB/NOP family class I SAM-dependent RNA methyltransferase [Phenylobacterium sp. J426]MCR5874982.1 RsmB/NOP family class I SAM-dependent RNA methyltransferase [Phenylobacterium sp. J426]
MKATDRNDAALQLLEEIARDPRPADAVISGFFRSRRDLSDADRGEVAELAYDVLRHHARLTWLLDRRGRPATARDRLQLFLAGGAIDHPDMPDDVRGECPPWAVAPLRARFGDAFAAEMAAMLMPPPLDLRVNPLKATREAVLADLRRLRLPAEPAARAPYGVRILERMSLARLPMLKNGAAEIQDEGSQLVAGLVDAQPGERVVDFCAGAGGKTLALASQMQNKGLVVACDVSEGRLKRAAQRFRNAGLHNIQTRLLSSERDKWVKRHKGGFDRVLVDAPCSGTGTWRRNPDARWRSDGFETLPPLQREILDSAARLVKPGGRLVYATCSLIPEENEAQVETFLSLHPDFQLMPQQAVADSAHDAYLSLTPARHGTDGFFAAVLTRAGSERPSS